ncbi:ABC transporter ATP-binding protein [Cupriavidus sp. USMAA2-4]|uniref:ABC transporter ATP-binding protein n=1 Tax=Cupriavidus sp. USMAA2-4 TaxID=876364 RepID=UPI000A06505C|nr:oligopeptide/dipeptide ABC transporter ATP-binding protein [Cupriavidus sp. USMAA2-4]
MFPSQPAAASHGSGQRDDVLRDDVPRDDVLLDVRDLRVHYALRRPHPFAAAPMVHAVDGVSFRVRRGSAFGIVGESGCGKSTTALALLRLVEASGGSASLDGADLLGARGAALAALRAKVQMIFQDPYSSLDPRQRVQDIIAKPMRQLTALAPAAIAARVDELMALVGLRQDQKRLFPHQFSGGQRQRIGIARALAVDPALVVCDEPVSALDVAIQAQVINLLARIQRERGLTYVFISHDLAVVQHLCDEVAVMYLGRIVERGSRAQLFGTPLHPYTHALMSAEPVKDPARRDGHSRIRLQGDPPSPLDPPAGCHFHTRCPAAEARCRSEAPVLRELDGGHHVACHRVVWRDGRACPPPPFAPGAAPAGVPADGAAACAA